MDGDRSVDSFATTSSVYVHIPFCSAVCPYCDFAVVAGQDELAGAYASAVMTEITRSARVPPLDAVYFGGGTPSHVDVSLLGDILRALAARHGIADDAEISLEANPEDFDQTRAEALVALGFNRVSFGAQSFDIAVLEELGRRHGPEHIAHSLKVARASGFRSVSLDLIFGSASETADSWSGTLRQAVALEPDHVSCYALTVEPGTPLAKAVAAGTAAPDPDAQADRYEEAVDVLGSAGYEQYEISNWARPERRCVYNLAVWAQAEFEGYGNGAHRFIAGSRSSNPRTLGIYLRRVEEGTVPGPTKAPMTDWDKELDRLFVGLRRTDGVAPGPGVEAFMASEEGRRLVEAGVAEVSSSRMKIVRPLLADEVNRVVLDLEPVPVQDDPRGPITS